MTTNRIIFSRQSRSDIFSFPFYKEIIMDAPNVNTNFLHTLYGNKEMTSEGFHKTIRKNYSSYNQYSDKEYLYFYVAK